MLRLARNAKSLFLNGTNEQKQKLVKNTLLNLFLDGNQLRWEMKKPLARMVFCNENSNWLGIIAEVKHRLINSAQMNGYIT
jgi:hypothetical protein